MKRFSQNILTPIIVLLLLSIFPVIDGSDFIRYNDGLVIPLYNRVGFLGLKTRIGNPPQQVELLLDTGSSTSWVVSEDNPFCMNDTKKQIPSLNCKRYGTYNYTHSDTFNTSKSPFKISYYDNTTVTGIMATDKFHLPTIRGEDTFTLDNFEFGVGEKTNSSVGILGLSIPHIKKKGSQKIRHTKEINDYKKVVYDNQNIVTEFKKAGLIDRSIFSIWLDDRSNHGELTIGSIDEAKYTGPLISTKLINYENPGEPIRKFQIGVTGIELEAEDGAFQYRNTSHGEDISSSHYDLFSMSPGYNERYIGALIDTGSVHTHLPVEIYNSLVKSLKSQYRLGDVQGYPSVPCFDDFDKMDPTKHTLSFKLNQASVKIPLQSFLKRDPVDSSKLLHSDQLPGRCILGIKPQYNNVTIIGQALFKSIYTVFDLDRLEVSMAPAKYTNKRALRKITLENDLNSIDDGTVDPSVTQELYDPSSDFVMDTRDGYYKLTSGANTLHRQLHTSHLIALCLSLAIPLISLH